ncbi:hypothetical protein Rhopal_007862-T1 [Rhodotorula paludigena]|uniref:Protein kinase domain-containing protein n=1 Tax=Rhodotorula paludigena TaxID=86838 RepID=A0AAV5GZ87_9BASI|nr:hypothetical protein Rhopal_007862-T1 [Rhodotorula paludigena]
MPSSSLTSSPSSLASPLPSSPPSPSPPRSPRQLLSSPGAAPSAASGTGGTSSTSSSGSGRGRRTTRGGSVQARRSAASLGLGVQFANMNELTSPLAHQRASSISPSPSPEPEPALPPHSGARSPLPRGSSPPFDLAPPPPQPQTPATLDAPPREPSASRRSSVQFAPTVPPSQQPPGMTSTPALTRAPSRRPSLTHLASFLSGITHHTRVRSPGASGGRGVSRSASRSASRASSTAGRPRRRERGASAGGASSAGGYAEDDESESERDERERDDDDFEQVRAVVEDGFDWFGGGPGGGATGAFRSPSAGRRRAPSSRASSIAPRSRRSSIVSQQHVPPGTPGPTSPHPLLHELVRENTTGGAVPSDVLEAGKAGQWEATYETYKPSVLTTPRGASHPRAAAGAGAHDNSDEEPFLESAPTSPAGLARTKTYDSVLSDSDDARSDVSNDLREVDVFDEGERVGVGVWLDGRGGYVRDCFAGRADIDGKAPGNGLDGPRQLEVERRLGEGTYAIVYLVREVLYDPDPADDDGDLLSPIDPLASFEFDDDAREQRPRMHSWASDTWNPMPPQPTYGQYFALKCLCKKNLTEDLIEVQRNEAFLHRALPQHENIVQMYGAYETDDWLFLVLEYAGGRDAFYWLLEAQEHGTEDLYSRAASPAVEYERRTSFDFDGDESALSRTITADTPAHLLVDETPPSPSLLSAAMGDQLLSRKRLRLISRMFGQMCSAVQACHDVGISHRDIKPENFIVIDGKGDGARNMPQHDARQGVVVKITDWGLGTMEEYCEDFDCGSKPYMAYECRNNLRPMYDPRQADVWSLGLVLLNLLYHRNPWADPSLDDPDFAEYVEDPVAFLQNRFEGMSDEVAHFLANNVFCDVLEVVDGRERRRVSAGEFGRWASRLVMMLGEGQLGAPQRPLLTSSESSYSAFEFSPVNALPLSIGGSAPIQHPSASLLSQFAPSTVKQSSIFEDLPGDLRHELPTVPEVPDVGSSTPGRPSFVTSPTALSEDGDSLPSPTFPSPPLPHAQLPNAQTRSLTASPEGLGRPMPWSTPSPNGLTAALSSNHSSPAAPPSPLPPPGLPLPANAVSGISLLAQRRPSLLDYQNDSTVSTASTIMASSSSQGGQDGEKPDDEPSREMATQTHSQATSPDPVVVKVEEPSSSEDGQAQPSSPVDAEDKGDAADDANGDKAAADKVRKRRKRGARKEKRAARQAEREAEASTGGTPLSVNVNVNGAASASQPSSPLSSPRSKKSSPLDGSDAREHVLDELANASQELARELSSTRSSSSHRPTRPRPVPSSRSHGTQSTSAIPTQPQNIPTAPSKKSGGMFGRLKTLVNEGNPDLEAFKRRVDERNASIGAKADTYSAPAKMQGAKAPRGKYDSPFSSRGSVGTGSGEADRGRGADHWSSASSRRDRLADRRGQRNPAGATTASDFSPGSSMTRGTGPSVISGFDTTSRNHTPLSSFSSVGSQDDVASSSMATVRDWRGGNSPPDKRSVRPPGLAPPLPVTTAPPATKPKPKLRDAATDTSDLGNPAAVAAPVPSAPPARKEPPRALSSAAAALPSPGSLSAPATPVLSAAQVSSASAPALSPSSTTPTSGASGSSQKSNKLAKMLNSISVFNRSQPAAGASPSS